jgi:hypothetical protein
MAFLTGVHFLPVHTVNCVQTLKAGSRVIGNLFINTTCSARWKGSKAVIANNTFIESEIANFEITYLQHGARYNDEEFEEPLCC